MSGSHPLPLAMNQTKAKLLEHLDLSQEIYHLMAKETDEVYKWLTSDPAHLKSNCVKDRPPYDWSDLREKSKDEAMKRLATSGSEETKCYWNLAIPTPDCDNWIAKWFIYHLFRHRDRRNRSGVKRNNFEPSNHKLGTQGRNASTSSKQTKHLREYYEAQPDLETQYDGSSSASQHLISTGSGNTSTQFYTYNEQPAYTIQAQEEYEESGLVSYDGSLALSEYTPQSSRNANEYWDPVRDI